MASNAPVSFQPPTFRETIRGLLPSILINAVLPFILYMLLKSLTSVSDIIALFISAIPVMVSTIIGIIRQGTVDMIAGFALVGIVVSVGAALIGGDYRLYLIRESFLTVALGIVCLISLLFPRPLWFYITRYFAAGKNPERIAAFNVNWQHPHFRSFLRNLTIIWGTTFVCEFLLRVFLVYHLSIPQFLVIGPIIFYAITFAVIASTFGYARLARRQAEELRRQRQMAGAGEPAGEELRQVGQPAE